MRKKLIISTGISCVVTIVQIPFLLSLRTEPIDVTAIIALIGTIVSIFGFWSVCLYELLERF